MRILVVNDDGVLSPGIVALLVFSAALILAAGLAGPRLEQVFQTALGVR